jgi:hypothetical protein
MPSYSSLFATALALYASGVSGHMIMKTPKPFGTPDNSPLSSSGSNFPCKLTGDPKTFYDRTDATSIAVGGQSTLSFTGSAVHGGGSCQLAVTTDLEPSASTQWEVILSIEGGCPSKDGTGPSDYDFTIPDSITAGSYVFAWIWISKLAGQPEYYMNCAPLDVTGGSSKRSEASNGTVSSVELLGRDSSLPNLFVANLASINSCKTTPGTDPVFPDPGTNVIKPGSNNNFATVTGDCFPIGGSSGSSGSDSSSSSSTDASPSLATSATSASPAASSSTTMAVSPFTTAASPTLTASTPISYPSPTGFITSITTAQSSSVAPLATSEATSPAAVPTTPEAASSAAASSPAAAPSPSTPTSSSSSSSAGTALTGACTQEGMFNCDGQNYQQCASGAWSAMRPLASGMKCTLGQSSGLFARGENGRIARRG